MGRADRQRVFDLFDLVEGELCETVEPVAVPPRVVLMFCYNNRTVATPARKGKPKRTHSSILNRLLQWMEKTGDAGVLCKPFAARTSADLACARLIIVYDFDPCYFESGCQGAIGALLRSGARLIGVSGTQRGDSAFASFKHSVRGEGFMELVDKRIGFVPIADLLRRHIREIDAA